MRAWPVHAVRAQADFRARVCVLEFRPDRVQPAVSIQTAWQGSRGVIRGANENGALVEDHMVTETGARISGADEMRRGIWTVDEHQAHYLEHHPDDRILGWVGNGNLLTNPGFVAGIEDRLFYVAGEERRFAHRRYHALAVWRDRRVTIQRLDLSAPLPPGLDCFTTGQRLVEAGKPLDTETLVRDALRGHYYDLRHLFLVGRVARGPKRWIDVGLSAFWNPGALEHAIRGLPVTADVSQFTAAEVHEALADKDYEIAADPVLPGQYSLHEGTLRIVLRQGIYPHNMIGIREDGTVLSVVVSGMSNRAGVTIRGAAELMCSLGARDALLIDNGGDVMMSFEGRMVLDSAEGERNRLRSILVFRCPREHSLAPGDARLIVYPSRPSIPLCA